MKIYIISEVSWEYNDESHYQPESEGGVPVKAFRVRKNAEVECRRLNRIAQRDNPMTDDNGTLIENHYEVVAVEVADVEVVVPRDGRSEKNEHTPHD